MKQFFQAFAQNVSKQPQAIAIQAATRRFSYQELDDQIKAVRALLAGQGVRRLALALENCPAWIVFDLAAAMEGIPVIPVPHFFTASQVAHLIEDAGIDTLVSGFTMPGIIQAKQKFYSTTLSTDYKLSTIRAPVTGRDMPGDTVKVSYTSGTTGQPKGVLIDAGAVDKVVESLLQTTGASCETRHLSVLPFSLLLENIAGIYGCLAAGGTCMAPRFGELGMNGSSSMDVHRFIGIVQTYRPTTMVTVPALAQVLVEMAEMPNSNLESLEFIAVGGAPIPVSTLERAQKAGLPLFQGYGLTECCSVVAVNSPAYQRIGSVGKPLPHVDVQIRQDGEVMVSGTPPAGYLNDKANGHDVQWATGDTGYIDADGYLFITGRKSTSYSTSFGRNVSPEWVESELMVYPQIRQAVIFGHGKPFNLAIIVPQKGASETDVESAISRANSRLPDYARISKWIRAFEPYSVINQQLSPAGLVKRENIYRDYHKQIESGYKKQDSYVT